MTRFLTSLLCLGLLAPAAVAQDGDPAQGEKFFAQCKTCHALTDDDGNDIVRGGKVGPNLYGVVGRQAGTAGDFNYSDYMVEAGEMGLKWNADDFATYVQDPTAFLRDYTGNKKARGKMTFRLTQEDRAPDIWAYLVSVSPEPEGDGGGS